MATTVFKGTLNFGLVSLPVKLSVAARKEAISFNQLRASDNSRVSQQLVSKADGKLVPRDQIVKGYEVSKDKFVVVTEDELKDAAPASSHTIEILEFVEAKYIDSLLFESSYYLEPDDGGLKAYALLYKGLKETKRIGIAKLVMSHQEHVFAIRAGHSGLVGHTLFYPNEVRDNEYRTDLGVVDDKELALAKPLILALSAPFEPKKYQDTYHANILGLIESKKNGKQTATGAKSKPRAASPDLSAALRDSLNAVKGKKGKAA